MRSSSAPVEARERSPRGSSRLGGGKGRGGWFSFARGGSSSSPTSEPDSDVEGGGRKSTRVDYPYGLSRAERYRLAVEKGKGKGASSRGAAGAQGDPDRGGEEVMQGVWADPVGPSTSVDYHRTSPTGPGDRWGPPQRWHYNPSRRQLWRVHDERRMTLYVPSEMGLPTPLAHLTNERVTHLREGANQVVITDDWRAVGEADPGYGRWTGVTVFTIQEMPVVDDEEIPCEDDWEWGEDEDEGPDPGEGDEPESGLSVRVESGPTAYAGSGSQEGPGSAYQAPTTAARQAAEDYVRAIEQDFHNTPMGWAAVLRAGNKLVEVAGGVRQAAESLWEVREKAGMMNLAQVDDPELDRVLHPHLLEYLRDVRRYGMAARFQGLRTRAFAKLHPNARRHVDKVFAQVAKDVGKQRTERDDGLTL